MIETQGATGSKNREGLRTYVRVFITDTEAEAERAGPEAINGIPVSDRSWKQKIGGKERWEVTVTYQGITGEEGEEDTITIRQVLREEPIESHPDIETIKTTYEGKEQDDGTLKFPATLASSKSGGTGLGGGKTTSTKNPMYGAKTYVRKSAEWSRSRLVKTLPDDLLVMAGRTSQKPTGAPRAPSGKIWVYGAAEATRKGNCNQITEKATLEDEKIGKAVYGALV